MSATLVSSADSKYTELHSVAFAEYGPNPDYLAHMERDCQKCYALAEVKKYAVLT